MGGVNRQEDFPKLWGRQKAEKALKGFAGEIDHTTSTWGNGHLGRQR